MSTNPLVPNTRKVTHKLAVPTTLAAAAVLGTVFFLHDGTSRAADITAPPITPQNVAALSSLDQAMEALSAHVMPSVVNVAVTAKVTPGANGEGDDEQGSDQGQQAPQGLPPGLSQFFGGGGQQAPQRPQLEHGIGSGVIISPDGYIVTNNHVVHGATQIMVTLHDRRVLPAKVIGVDELTDLAVIKVNATDLPALSWGDSTKLEPGQTVLAFGSPFGSLRFSVTRGIISAINRQNPYRTDARRPSAFIQTDAAVNPGNSGGPLVDVQGQLIGINSSIITSSGSFAGASFAIPSQIVRSTADQLIKTGTVHHGYLGISMNDVTPANAHFFNLSKATGAIVAQVSPGSPAATAGIKNGDVIEQLNGQPVLDGSALQVAIADVRPGTKVQFGLLRDGQPQSVQLTVGEYHPNGEVADSDNGAPGSAHGGKLGVGMADITPDVRQQLQLPDGIQGAAIESVRPGSPAEDAGLQPGDVIVQVDRHAVTSASQVVSDVHALPANQDVLLLVWSHGGESYRVVRPSQG